MRLSKTARAILSVTAFAWSIPFAQAAASRDAALSEIASSSAEYDNRQRSRDGRQDVSESVTDEQIKDRQSGA